MSDPIKANALVGGLLNQVTVDSGLNVSTMLSLFRHFRHLDPNAVPETTLPVTVTPNYHYAAGSYGDVDMPVQPLDQQVIISWSAPAPATAPSSINVAVVNTTTTVPTAGAQPPSSAVDQAQPYDPTAS